MASIKITTGMKIYDIEDEHGNIRGQISFNPSDMNFFARANQTQEMIQQAIAEFKNIDDENVTEGIIIEKLEKIDTEIKEEINRLFDDSNTSNVIFGNQNCLNTLNGVTFIERFLTAFAPIIKADFESEKKKSSNRIAKYTKQVK